MSHVAGWVCVCLTWLLSVCVCLTWLLSTRMDRSDRVCVGVCACEPSARQLSPLWLFIASPFGPIGELWPKQRGAFEEQPSVLFTRLELNSSAEPPANYSKEEKSLLIHSSLGLKYHVETGSLLIHSSLGLKYHVETGSLLIHSSLGLSVSRLSVSRWNRNLSALRLSLPFLLLS